MLTLKEVIGEHIDPLLTLEDGLIDVGEKELAKQVNKLIGDLLIAFVEKEMGV